MTRLTLATGRGSDYAQLSSLIKQARLLTRRRGYYLAKLTLTAGLFVAGWTAFGLLGRP